MHVHTHVNGGQKTTLLLFLRILHIVFIFLALTSLGLASLVRLAEQGQ